MERIDQTIRHARPDTFFLLAGPCVVENERVVMQTAARLLEITTALGIPYAFKASYRKANRSRGDSFTGIGDGPALELLARVRGELGVPIVTDIHNPQEAALAAPYADVLQIPAFLSRQTDLLAAAAATGRWVNVKKGQFMAPEAMEFAVQKVAQGQMAAGLDSSKILLTDRGTMFGYQDLIVDLRGIPIMQRTGCPVVMDITHSLQQPNQTSGVSGGLPQMIETIARAAMAVGVDGIFMETHPDPTHALSDGKNMLPLDRVEPLLERLLALRRTVAAFDE